MIKAVIFDMDGVISDTQQYHALAESALLKERGVDMAPDYITQKYSGVQDEVMFEEILGDHNVQGVNVADLVARKWDVMARLMNGKITAIPGILPLLKYVREQHLKTAIASASPHTFIATVIEGLDIQDSFDALVSAQDVTHGKPAPDIFLLAAEKLGVESADCLVIEDGMSGMIGARAAGMRVLGYSDSPEAKRVADVTTTSFDSLDRSSLLE